MDLPPPDLLHGTERSSRRTRRTSPGAVVHAVPRDDRTRTALCGASVAVVGGLAFTPSGTSVCGECARLAVAPLAKAG